MLPVFGKRLFYGALWWTHVALHLVLLQIQNQRLYWSQVKIHFNLTVIEITRGPAQKNTVFYINFSRWLMPWNGDFSFFLSHVSKLLWQNAGNLKSFSFCHWLNKSHSLFPLHPALLSQPTPPRELFQKGTNKLHTVWKRELFMLRFHQQRSTTLQSKNTFIEKKKYTELLFKRLQKTWKEMEASLCVMRIVVYCIRTGPCGLPHDFYFEWQKKIISAIVTLSLCGAEVGARL